MKALEVSNVSKIFYSGKEKIIALDNVSFDINMGEIFGILGPNGAGKTTLLNCITGLLESDLGTIRILGKTTHEDKNILEEVNYVSGESRFHWSLNAYEILDFFGRLYNVPREIRLKRIEELIDIFEIRSFENRRFENLSTGQKMRLVLAKSLVNNPKMLLLDEPTLGLDPHIANKVRRLILRVNKERKTTIILTSHYMGEVEQLCGRIAFINKGRIVDIGRINEVKNKRFYGYELIIELRRIFDQKFLETLKFKVTDKKIRTILKNDQNITGILSELVDHKYIIKDIEVKKPSLEDYFVRMIYNDKDK